MCLCGRARACVVMCASLGALWKYRAASVKFSGTPWPPMCRKPIPLSDTGWPSSAPCGVMSTVPPSHNFLGEYDNFSGFHPPPQCSQKQGGKNRPHPTTPSFVSEGHSQCRGPPPASSSNQFRGGWDLTWTMASLLGALSTPHAQASAVDAIASRCC